jgi:Rha family phage regulatory protein
MFASISSLDDFVMVAGDAPVTDSRRVAKAFDRRHDHVLRDIRRLLRDLPEEHRLPNFGECFENNSLANGKPEPLFRMTKDGFMLLVMGFTGRKALAVKLAFIKAFNAMAEHLRTGLWHQRRDAEAAYLAGKVQASAAGRNLRRWRDEKPERLRVITHIYHQMELPLLLG